MEFFEGLGMYPHHALVDLSDKLHEKVIESIGTLALSVVDGVTNIGSRNNAADDLSAVLPHELIKISTAAYGKHVVDVHIQQLRQCSSWSDEAIAEIENQYRQLLNVYRTEPVLKSVLDI